jgi:hypothetical protein
MISQTFRMYYILKFWNVRLDSPRSEPEHEVLFNFL